jgi:hypothetical protein
VLKRLTEVVDLCGIDQPEEYAMSFKVGWDRIW